MGYVKEGDVVRCDKCEAIVRKQEELISVVDYKVYVKPVKFIDYCKKVKGLMCPMCGNVLYTVGLEVR